MSSVSKISSSNAEILSKPSDGRRETPPFAVRWLTAVWGALGGRRAEPVLHHPLHESLCTFLVAKTAGIWRVSRDGEPFADFQTRGDAVRAACFEARTSDAAGHPAQVLASPSRGPLPHYEPHFAV
jgi:hypothetical protein